MDKDERERRALLTVYSAPQLELFTHQDRPDFRLARRGGPQFGVEVTDIYPSDTHARVTNRPDYMPRLFGGGRHMAKEDYDILKVVRVQVADPDGTVVASDLPAIISEVPSESARLAKLASAIRTKSAKFSDYDGDLSHVNLIVVDHYSPIEDGFAPYSVSDTLGGGVREALLGSPFREVFVVGRDLTGTVFYRPLYLIMLMEQFSVLGHAIDAFEGPLAVRREQFSAIFVHAMLGSPLVLAYSDSPGGGYAVSRCKGVRLTDSAVELIDSSDFGGPKATPVPDLPMEPAVWEAFRVHHERFAATATMQVGIASKSATPDAEPFPPSSSMTLVVEQAEPTTDDGP